MATEYIQHDEAEKIATDLIEKYHTHLSGLKIAYLLKVGAPPKKKKQVSARPGKKVVMARASKVTAKTVALAGKDFRFVIEFDFYIWDVLTDHQKIALVDHELCHCGNDADGVYMKSHSLEEFREVIDRNGFWMDDVRSFAESTEAAYHAEQDAPAEVSHRDLGTCMSVPQEVRNRLQAAGNGDSID